MRLITSLSFLSIMSFGICFMVTGPALSGIQATFMVSQGKLGLFITMLSVGLMLSVLSGGYVVDRYGIKAGLLTGQLLLSAGLSLFSMTDCFSVGLGSFFIIGIGGGLIEIATNTVISDIYPEKRVSWINILHAFFGIGALIGPVLSGFIISQGLEWQNIYKVVALFSILIATFMIFQRFPKGKGAEKVEFSHLKGLIRDPIMLLIGMMMLLYVGSEMGINYWSVIYMEGHFSIDTLIASSFLSYFWVALTAGRFICFLIARRVSGKTLLLFLSTASLLSYSAFLMAGTMWAAGIFLALTGLFFSGVFPTILALGVDRYPDEASTTNGFLLSFMGLGILFFPYQMGVVAEILSLTHGMSVVIFAILLLVISSVTLRSSKHS